MSQVKGHKTLANEDVRKMLVARSQVGTRKCNINIKPYIAGRRPDGIHIFDVSKTWEKIVLAARVLATIANPSDVAVVASRVYAQRATHKMCHYLGFKSFAGRFMPGTFTNRMIPDFIEPRVIIVNDPWLDKQAVSEAAYSNTPVIAFVTSESPMENVDIAIPCNNRGKESIGLMYWLLSREVLRIKGKLKKDDAWIIPDMFVHMDQEELERCMREDETAMEAAAQSRPERARAEKAVEPVKSAANQDNDDDW